MTHTRAFTFLTLIFRTRHKRATTTDTTAIPAHLRAIILTYHHPIRRSRLRRRHRIPLKLRGHRRHGAPLRHIAHPPLPAHRCLPTSAGIPTLHASVLVSVLVTELITGGAIAATPPLSTVFNRPVSVRGYAERIVIGAEGQVIAEHPRVIARGRDYRPRRTL